MSDARIKTKGLEEESLQRLFPLSRREFLKLCGGGIVVFFTWGEAELLAQERRGAGREYPADFNAYLLIGEDGRVSCFTGKTELGQGVVTSLAQILAEELDVPFEVVDMVMGDTALCPWDMGTFGSRSIKYFGPALRAAAAEARAVLIQMAAESLRLPEDELDTRQGFVIEKKNPTKKIPYADLTKGKKIEKRLDREPALKPVQNYSISGKPIGRTDGRAKITGEAKYAGDIRLEGMLYARILRPPAHGWELISLDTAEAEKMEGVLLIKDGDLIAVLHPTPDGAAKALAGIKARFDGTQDEVDEETIFNRLLKVAPEGEVVEQQGNLEEGQKLSVLRFEEAYYQGYVAHAPVEPHTAIAQVQGNTATIWASTQRPFGLQGEAAQALGIPLENVRVVTPFVGGGFGGKNRNVQAVEAVRLARLAGKPVQVAWTREEEFFFDTFMPSAVIKIISGLNQKNEIVYWDYEIFFAGDRSSQVFYDVPHFRVFSRGGWGRPVPGAHPFGVGAWRGPGSNTNIFARESHIDVMASRVRVDPLEFRLKNLKNDRMKRVLLAAAEKFRWESAPAPSSRGHGIACLDYLGTYVATMAEVEVNKGTGEIQVKRVVSAQDMGVIINPDGARSQMEGGITMGLGYALKEAIRFQGGKIADLNFDTYEIPRFSWTPEIETVLIDNPDLPSQGGGEPAVTAMGAVLANAVFDAIGARLTRLPMSPQRVKAALRSSKS